ETWCDVLMSLAATLAHIEQALALPADAWQVERYRGDPDEPKWAWKHRQRAWAEFRRSVAGMRWTLQQFACAAEGDAPPEVLDLIRAEVGEDDADEPLTVAALCPAELR